MSANYEDRTESEDGTDYEDYEDRTESEDGTDYEDYAGDTASESEKLDTVTEEIDTESEEIYTATKKNDNILESVSSDDENSRGCALAYRVAFKNFKLSIFPAVITDEHLDEIFVKVNYRKEHKTLEKMFPFSFLPYLPEENNHGYMSLRDASNCTVKLWREAWYGGEDVQKKLGRISQHRYGFNYSYCAEEQTFFLHTFEEIESLLTNTKHKRDVLKIICDKLNIPRKQSNEEQIRNILRTVWQRDVNELTSISQFIRGVVD